VSNGKEITTLGFQTIPQVFFPFPYSRCPYSSRTVNRITCQYSDPDGVPYTKIQRLWFETIVTEAVQQVSPLIIFGRVSDAIEKIGQSRTGMYMGPAKKAIAQIAKLSISISKDSTVKSYVGIQGINCVVGRKYQVLWMDGKPNDDTPELFEDENYLELSADFFALTQKAVPHIREQYAAIQSPRTQDLYVWLVLRLYHLKDEVLIPWQQIYDQFGKGNLGDKRTRGYLRDEVKSGLWEIKTRYYPNAKIETTEEGIILNPSPPLIEPNNPKAGYLIG